MIEQDWKTHVTTAGELADITGTVMLSSKVDEGLKEWLKTMLKQCRREISLTDEWLMICYEHPEVDKHVLELLGRIPPPEDERLRIQ
jgi:hypothetical protein